MKKLTKILAFFLAGAAAAGCLSACVKQDPLAKGKINITYWAEIYQTNKDIIDELVDTFNKTNEDNIYVKMVPQSVGYSQSLSTTLKGKNPPDVVMIDDRYFKGYVNNDYLEPLDGYIEKSSLDLSDFWQSTVERCQYDPETGYSGGGNTHYALPDGNTPTLIFYNADMFEEQKVHVISVAEEELEAYNEKNGTEFLPHGYYAYKSDPTNGSLSPRKDGLYHVFNNQIAMSWEELLACSRIFTKEFNSSSSSRYGFMNEWWFSYGWSVGGDCLEWSEELDQYIFALGEDVPNYLVTGQETVTVNGTEYAEGELLSYADKHYVAEHKADADISAYLAAQRLYEFPSIYDAFLEFCRLSQSTSKDVSTGVKGYGVSPSPTTLSQKGKNLYFTSGELAMLVQGASEAYTIGRQMESAGIAWDVAPCNQYREFNEDGTLKTVNGTPVVGRKAAHNGSKGYAIPKNSKKKAAAWKFIEYMTGREAQAIMIKANLYVPNQKSLAYSETFMNDTSNYAPKNKAALVDAAAYGTVGDWSYVEDGEWINGWANILNTSVRDGNMTLEQFFVEPAVLKTNETLKKYKAKKFNG